MRWFVIMAAILAVNISAEPEPSPARVFQYQFADETMSPFAKQDQMLNINSDGSSGRFFTKKFFKKVFGQNQKPPTIIITGINGDTSTNIDTPISTDISTPTATTIIEDPAPDTDTNPADTATPIVTNTPIDPADPVDPADPIDPADPVDPVDTAVPVDPATPVDTATPIDPAAPERRFQLYNANQRAKRRGPQDFIVVGQKVKNTFTASGNRVPARLILTLRGGRRNKIVTISLPAKYRGYFKNGQRVILHSNNTASRPGKTLVIRRRKNRRRNNKNKKNKRRRFISN